MQGRAANRAGLILSFLFLFVFPSVCFAGNVQNFKKITLSNSPSKINFKIQPPSNAHFTQNDKAQYDFSSFQSGILISPIKGSVQGDGREVLFSVQIQNQGKLKKALLKGKIFVSYCVEGPPKVCKYKDLEINIPLVFSSQGPLEAQAKISLQE